MKGKSKMSKLFIMPEGVDLEEFYDPSPQEENENLLENSPEDLNEKKCPSFLNKILDAAADILGFAGK